LIALGASVGLMSEEARNLILAGAMVSIALNPSLFAWVRTYGEKITGQDINDDNLAHLAEEEIKALKGTVIVIGHGKVGSQVAHAMNEERVELIIIEENREKVESLRQQGFRAIVGKGGGNFLA
jgi:CPA2 family monovalent cation:H+ antiporter-2